MLDLLVARLARLLAGRTTMKTVSLFSGIGGLDLGLEDAGHEIILQVESDPHCVQVRSRHDLEYVYRCMYLCTDWIHPDHIVPEPRGGLDFSFSLFGVYYEIKYFI